MKPQKVLVLTHRSCVPPQGATVQMASWADWKTEFHLQRSLKKLGHQVVMYGVTHELDDLFNKIKEIQPDMVFNLLEEFQGEPSFESNVVAFLELMEIPFTGCNSQGLALGRDKALSKKILDYHGVPTPQFFIAPLNRKIKIPEDFPYPLIVKSLNEEASLGISQDSIVHNSKKLKERIEFVHRTLGTSALVEQYIPGREFYVGVIGNNQLKVLPPWELNFGNLDKKAYPIATRSVKFNKKYCEKYGIKRGVVKDLPPFTLRKVENLSRAIYKALKMSGYARLDFRLDQEGRVYFLEANPNAELAKGECLANAAQHAGITYDELVSKIMSLGRSYQLAA